VRVAVDTAPGGARLSGATVRLRTPAGRLIGRDTTGELGVSLADLRVARAPRAFTVEVSGGRIGGRRLIGTLRAQVRGYRAGRTVIVDLPTTLAAAWQRAHAGVGPAEAARAVEARLGIPVTHRLGAQVVAPAHFDGAAALRGAQAVGGVDRWAAAEVARLGRAAPRARTRQGSSLASPQLTAALGSLSGLFEIANVGVVVYSIYEDLFGGGSSSGTGATQQDVTQIETDLGTLQSNVQTLTTDVTALGYSNGANTLEDTTIADVTSAYTQYSTLLQANAQSSGDANSSGQGVVAAYGQQFIGTQPLTSLSQITAANLPSIVANASSTSFVGTAKANGLTTTAAPIAIATTAGANPSGGLGGPAPGASGLIAQASLASTTNLRWFDADDAAVAAAVWRYYSDAFSAAANIVGTYELLTTASVLSAPPASVTCGQSAPAGTPEPTTQYVANMAQLDCYRGALQIMEPTPFPQGTVLDLTTYTMWSTEVGAQLSQPTWRALNGQPATLGTTGVQSAAATLAPGTGADTALIGANPQTPSDAQGTPLADWQLASATQLGALYAPTPATTGQTLTAAGFDANLLWPGGHGTSIQWSQDDNGYWGPFGYSTTVNTSKGCATTGYSCGLTLSARDVPLGSVTTCSQPCMSPSYAGGTTLGLWDLNGGIDLYTDPVTSTIGSINGTGLQNLANVPSPPYAPVPSPTDQGSSFTYNWSNLYNWFGSYQSCGAFLALGNSSCGASDNVDYPDIQTTLSTQGLPSLFYRTPVVAAAGSPANECYFWPAGSGSAPAANAPATQPSGTTNGCPGAG
jgi:hypothetical protein